MGAQNFVACFIETAGFEGGYVNNPHDPGGSTMCGVTQATYTAYLKDHGRPDALVKNISVADRQAIYHRYWDPMRCDELPDGLDLVMVDTAWGSGLVEPVRFLQRSVGVTADGKFGPLTMKAVKATLNGGMSVQRLIELICEDRMAFFKSLPTWKYFGTGWTNRLNGIKATALKMATAKQSVAGPAPSAPATPGATAPKESNMVEPTPAPAPVAAAAAPAVHIDAGDWLNQLIHMIEPELEAGAEGLASLAAAAVPGGTLILDIVGKKMVGQVVAEAAIAAEGLASKLNIEVHPTNVIEGMALDLISNTVPKVAAMFGPKLSGWITAEVASLIPKAPKLNPSGAIGS